MPLFKEKEGEKEGGGAQRNRKGYWNRKQEETKNSEWELR